MMLCQRSSSFLASASDWWFTGASQSNVLTPEPLEQLQPQIFNVLRNGFFVDKLYEATIIRFNASFRVSATGWNDGFGPARYGSPRIWCKVSQG